MKKKKKGMKGRKEKKKEKRKKREEREGKERKQRSEREKGRRREKENEEKSEKRKKGKNARCMGHHGQPMTAPTRLKSRRFGCPCTGRQKKAGKGCHIAAMITTSPSAPWPKSARRSNSALKR